MQRKSYYIPIARCQNKIWNILNYEKIVKFSNCFKKKTISESSLLK